MKTITIAAWENLSDAAKAILEPYREEYANALFKYCMVSFDFILESLNFFHSFFFDDKIRPPTSSIEIETHSFKAKRGPVDGPSTFSALLAILDTLMSQVFTCPIIFLNAFQIISLVGVAIQSYEWKQKYLLKMCSKFVSRPRKRKKRTQSSPSLNCAPDRFH